MSNKPIKTRRLIARENLCEWIVWHCGLHMRKMAVLFVKVISFGTNVL